MSMGRLVWTVGAVALVCLAVTFAHASNWPRFRGPNGSGVSDAKTIPVTWADKNILWKVELPGRGNSSPVIWNGRLFIQSASVDGSERMLLCLDTKTGSTLWTQKAAGNKFKTLHKFNTLASASPAVDAERVYAVFWDGAKQIINAYTHDGQPLWTHNLGSFASQHGAGASPIPVGNRVIFNNDQDKKAELLCFDGKTGKVVWRAERPANTACYSSPLMRTLADGKTPELIVCTTMGITGYDPENGAKHWDWQWKFKQKLLRTVASPVYDQGIIFASSGDNPIGPRHLVAVRPGDHDPKLLWENVKDFPYMSTVVAYDKHIYCVNDQGLASCFEEATGKKMWDEHLEGDFSSSPIIINGKIYVANLFGDVYVFAANPARYEHLARNSVNELVRATPAVADERLFIRGEKHLFCIGKQ